MGALAIASRRSDVPRLAKVTAFVVVAYALSPVDLIPDVIPVLGYLDDLVLLPLGILLARRLVPDEVLAECRAQARQRAGAEQPHTHAGAWIVAGTWVALLALVAVAWRRIG